MNQWSIQADNKYRQGLLATIIITLMSLNNSLHDVMQPLKPDQIIPFHAAFESLIKVINIRKTEER